MLNYLLMCVCLWLVFFLLAYALAFCSCASPTHPSLPCACSVCGWIAHVCAFDLLCVFYLCVFVLGSGAGLPCVCVFVCWCANIADIGFSQSVSQSVVLLLHPSLCLRLRLLLCFPLTCLSLVLSFDLLIAFVVHHAICVSSPPVDDWWLMIDDWWLMIDDWCCLDTSTHYVSTQKQLNISGIAIYNQLDWTYLQTSIVSDLLAIFACFVFGLGLTWIVSAYLLYLLALCLALDWHGGSFLALLTVDLRLLDLCVGLCLYRL